MKRVLIIGATSAIAQACARLWAVQGASMALCARDPAKLAQVAQDLRLRGAGMVREQILDVRDAAACMAAVDQAWTALGAVELVLLAHGSLPDQTRCESDPQALREAFDLNATATLALLAALSPRMQAQGQGAIAVISSVAGDRGRASNFVYGSAKAAVQAYCEGLGARLARHGVRVIDIRPGFIATPMTQDLALPALLVAQPADIAPRILRAIEAGKSVVYVPGFWAWIMLVIRLIPRVLFRRLPL